MIHVLEHIYDPSELIQEIRRILKNEGEFVLEVPNIDSFEAKLFRNKWSALDSPRHLYLFTPATLIELLCLNGFEVGQIGYSPSPVSFAMSLDNLFRNGHLKKFIKKIGKYSAYLFLPFTVVSAMVHKGSSVIISARKIMR